MTGDGRVDTNKISVSANRVQTGGDESGSDILIKSSGKGQLEDRRRQEISLYTKKYISLPASLFIYSW